ncbi:MAG: FecR domain-containing protein [Pseudomonadota bacterium]
MVSKLTVRLIAAASSLALLANGNPKPSHADEGASDDSGLGRIVSVAGDPKAFQVAAIDSPIVGSTDIVRREARGIFEENIRELELRDDVFFNETVETGEDSALRITLLDNTSLTLGPSSRVVLDEFVYDPASQQGRLVMRLVSGVFRFTSGLMPKSSYSIGTPAGDIGIRGTVLDLWLFCTGDQESDADIDGLGRLCRLTIDVEEGSGVVNPGPTETPFDEGQRVEVGFDPDDINVGPIPANAPILEQVRVMRQLVLQAAFGLIEEQLPGQSISNADDDQLSAAVTNLLNRNPALAQPLTDAVANLAPGRVATVGTSVVTFDPNLADTVAETITNAATERQVLGLSTTTTTTQLDPSNFTSDETPPPYNPGDQAQ